MGDSLKENEVLRAEKISFVYASASKSVLSGVNFSLLRSQITFLIGPGGMGKTTLLKLFAGLLPLHEGQLWIQGAPLHLIPKREKRIVLSRVAMTFQRSGLFDSMSVLDNLLFPLSELTLLSKTDRIGLAQKALEQVKMTGNEEKFPHEISGGMQKRLGIARALVMQPELILYDDPTAGLDPITSAHIMDLILKVHSERNLGTLIATSDLDLALRTSERTGANIAFLYQGQIIEVALASNLLASKNPVIYQFTRGLIEGPLNPVEAL